MDIKQFLDSKGLSLYDSLIKKYIQEHEVDLTDMKLTDSKVLELYFTKEGTSSKLSVDLSSLTAYAEWEEL